MQLQRLGSGTFTYSSMATAWDIFQGGEKMVRWRRMTSRNLLQCYHIADGSKEPSNGWTKCDTKSSKDSKINQLSWGYLSIFSGLLLAAPHQTCHFFDHQSRVHNCTGTLGPCLNKLHCGLPCPAPTIIWNVRLIRIPVPHTKCSDHLLKKVHAHCLGMPVANRCLDVASLF